MDKSRSCNENLIVGQIQPESNRGEGMSENPKSTPKEPYRELNSWQRKSLEYTSLFITGTGIGWLVGLSVSPVISNVITVVVGSAAAIIAAASGLEDKFIPLGSRSLDIFPLTMLIAGLVFGSYLGICTRTYDWLEPSISKEVRTWVSAGIPEEEVVRAMFNARFFSTDVTSNTTAFNEGVLFADSINECDSLRSKTGDELKRELATSTGNPKLRKLPEIIKDVDVLKELVEQVLCPA